MTAPLNFKRRSSSLTAWSRSLSLRVDWRATATAARITSAQIGLADNLVSVGSSCANVRTPEVMFSKFSMERNLALGDGLGRIEKREQACQARVLPLQSI